MGNSGGREQKVVFFKQVFFGNSYVSSNHRVTFLNLMGTFSHLQLKVQFSKPLVPSPVHLSRGLCTRNVGSMLVPWFSQ